MGTEYKVRAYNAAGTMVDEFTDFVGLAYRKVVNGVGIGEVILPGQHRVIERLDHRASLEVWRRNRALGLSWVLDFTGLFLDRQLDYTDQETFTLRCPEINWLLSTRHNLWYAGRAGRTQFTSIAAETILKSVVGYNCGPDATALGGRIRDGAIANLSIETDAAGGNTLNVYCAWTNVLRILQSVAKVAGGDFDLVRTAPAVWEFRWFPGQLGTDRTDAVTFSLAFGNMASPSYRYNRRDEKTYAIVAGQGQGEIRDVVGQASATWSAANDVEVFGDGRDIDYGDSAALQDRAFEKLSETQAVEKLDFDVLQIPTSAYGVHYGLGDLVSARWRDIEAVQKIVAVTVSVSAGGDNIEDISVEMETQ